MRPEKSNKVAGVPNWTWDGNRIEPTLTPSIDCKHCGWHGHITKGLFT